MSGSCRKSGNCRQTAKICTRWSIFSICISYDIIGAIDLSRIPTSFQFSRA